MKPEPNYHEFDQAAADTLADMLAECARFALEHHLTLTMERVPYVTSAPAMGYTYPRFTVWPARIVAVPILRHSMVVRHYGGNTALYGLCPAIAARLQ